MNKLTLIINDQEKADDKKTAAYPRRRPRKFGRRRLTGGIRFFDLGYKKVSESVYQTLPYVDPYAADPFNPGALPFFDFSEVKHLDLTRVTALNDLIFETPMNQWASTFHQYDSLYYEDLINDRLRINWRGTGLYELLDPSGDAVFIDDKFVPPSDPVDNSFVFWWVNRYFGHIMFESSVDTKVTATNDYAADPVTFIPSKNFDVFMFPALGRVGGYMQYFVPDNPGIPLGHGTAHYWYIGHNFMVYPRETEFDPLNDYYDLDDSRILENLATLDSTEYTKITKGFRFIQEHHPTFARKYEFVSSTSTWSETDINIEDAYPNIYYPEAPSLPTPPAATVSLQFRMDFTQYVAGQLLAVIKQGGAYYYVWADDTFLTY